MPSIIRYSRTSKIIQIIRDISSNIGRSSNKMFSNGIDQSINTIRQLFVMIKDVYTIIIFFNSLPNLDSRLFNKVSIPPISKSTRESSSNKVNNFLVAKTMISDISISNHRHMIHFIKNFLLR
jgi:hypothetical protein